VSAVSFDHLRRLTDDGGLYEHALLDVPRPEHGYCVDDVARGLVVVCREPIDEADAHADLRAAYLAFVLEAQAPDGRFRNRRAIDLTWSGPATVGDCWGRALWSLGEVVARPRSSAEGSSALLAFERGAAWWTPWPRAMAFAMLGAAGVHSAHPDNRAAREMLAVGAQRLSRPAPTDDWPWPEQRLTYANAVIPEALLAAGSALDNDRMIENALVLLEWLVTIQTYLGNLSVVPVGGRGPAEPSTRFDQQPIEVSSLADAAARALSITGDARWSQVITMAAAWFDGANDSGTVLHDPVTGGGFDGLEARGRNENQGAESTLALLSTMQHARALRVP
jgi:hypothetical protein